MADVSLDDLIKQDKEKQKAQRTPKVPISIPMKTFKKKIILKQKPRQDFRPSPNAPHPQTNRPQHPGNFPRNKFEGRKFQAPESAEGRQGKVKPPRVPKEEREQEDDDQK
jgi:hypothetical protein